MTDTWPIGIFKTRDVNWSPRSLTGDGVVAGDGSQRPWQSDGGGKWMCTMTVDIFTPQAVKLARAMRVRMDLGLTPLIVPCVEAGFAPWPGGEAYPDAGFGDGAMFSDGGGFAMTVIEIELAETADLRATELSLTVTVAGELVGGERFSIDHTTKGRRMYDIGSVIEEVDGSYTVTIWPPLREDTPEGTPLNFDRPGCLMRLVNHRDIMKAIGLNRFSGLTPAFEEADEYDG